MKHPPEKQDVIERILQDACIIVAFSLISHLFIKAMGW